jgi:hypothetical protein
MEVEPQNIECRMSNDEVKIFLNRLRDSIFRVLYSSFVLGNIGIRVSRSRIRRIWK